MARKVVNRKELRVEAEAAEALAGTTEGGKKTKAKAEKKAPVKRKSRSKTAQPERRKLFWGVFNQSAKRIALFDFGQRKAAEAKAQELTSGGTPEDIANRIHAEIVRVLEQPDVRNRLNGQGFEVGTLPPQALGALLRRDLERWGKVIRTANIKIQ